MSLQGPIVVIAEQKHAGLVSALGRAGAYAVVEVAWADGPAAITRIEPAAVVCPDHDLPSDPVTLEKIQCAIATVRGPHMPVIARLTRAGPAIPGALPIAADASPARIVARLASALRVRTLHATALRRADALKGEWEDLPALPDSDPLDDATVLLTGRGRTYPALTTAVGERLGLIGALSVETAAKYLNARTVDGLIIGEGFSPRVVEAFLTVLAEDSRFRDLPIGLMPTLPNAGADLRLPNLERIGGEPDEIVARMLPLFRLHALAARLQRQLTALETKGLIDPQTGLFTVAAFLRDLNRAVADAKERGVDITLARFSFPSALGRRADMDAARLVSRLVRSADFACRASDGSILLTFSGTALRTAHVVARRIASVLRHTMLAPEAANGRQTRIDPTVTLAALKATDTVESLLARVSEPATVAAE